MCLTSNRETWCGSRSDRICKEVQQYCITNLAEPEGNKIMIIATIILTIIAIVLARKFFRDPLGDTDLYLVGTLFVSVAVCICGVLSVHWQLSSDSLSGYIYHRSDTLGYASYDIRYSQNAGTDNQPGFCVKAGSPTDKKFQALVGTGQTVKIYIPARAPFLSNNFAQCSSNAQLVEASNDGTR